MHCCIVHIDSVRNPFIPVSLVLTYIMPYIFGQYSVTSFQTTVRLRVERRRLYLLDLQQFESAPKEVT
jgi:hypothetical protein